jgi:hypothetical protein
MTLIRPVTTVVRPKAVTVQITQIVRLYIIIGNVKVLYGCETWSPTLREKHRLRVIENWVLRRIFRPKRDEVTGA